MPPPVAPRKSNNKVLKGKVRSGSSSLGSPRGTDIDHSECSDDDDANSSAANQIPQRPPINPLVLHGPEEIIQLADNIADVEDFCHRLVEDLVEMVQDSMLASHVDRIAVPWTVQDVIAQLYAGMHFCIAERDCPAPTVMGPELERLGLLAPEKDLTEHDDSEGQEEENEDSLNALQVFSNVQTPHTEPLGNASRATTTRKGSLKEMAIPIPDINAVATAAPSASFGVAHSSRSPKSVVILTTPPSPETTAHTNRVGGTDSQKNVAGKTSGRGSSAISSGVHLVAASPSYTSSGAIVPPQKGVAHRMPLYHRAPLSIDFEDHASYNKRSLNHTSNSSSHSLAGTLRNFLSGEGGGGGSSESFEAEGGIFYDPSESWVDYKAGVEEPEHIPADSWSRGVISIRRRLFDEGSNTINTSVLSPYHSHAVLGSSTYPAASRDHTSAGASNSVGGGNKRTSLRPSTGASSSSRGGGAARTASFGRGGGGQRGSTTTTTNSAVTSRPSTTTSTRAGSASPSEKANRVAVIAGRGVGGVGVGVAGGGLPPTNSRGKSATASTKALSQNTTNTKVSGAKDESSLMKESKDTLKPKRAASSARLLSTPRNATEDTTGQQQPQSSSSSPTLELLQSSDDGLKEEDKKIIAEDRRVREQMAKLKASSAELSRQLGEIKISSSSSPNAASGTNFIVDQRAGKVILQARTDKMEPIEGSIAAAQAAAGQISAFAPPPSAINNGIIGGIVPVKIVTVGGSGAGEKSDAELAAEAAAAALAAAEAARGRGGRAQTAGANSPQRALSPTTLANVSAINATGDKSTLVSPSRAGSALGQTIGARAATASTGKKLPMSAYFSVETRVANPMIASQVVPAGGVSSREGDSVLVADLAFPPVPAGVRPMSRQEFLKAQKGSGGQLPSARDRTTLGGDDAYGGSSASRKNSDLDLHNNDHETANGADNSELGDSPKPTESGSNTTTSSTARTTARSQAAGIATERPQSTPPDIGAAAKTGASRRKPAGGGKGDADLMAGGGAQRPASSLLAKFGRLTTTVTNPLAMDDTAAGAFNTYRSGGVTLPPRPASTMLNANKNNRLRGGSARRELHVPNASKLAQQHQQDDATSSGALPAVVATRRHFKPIFDNRGNPRPATAASILSPLPLPSSSPSPSSTTHTGGAVVSGGALPIVGDSMAATNALKYVLSKKKGSGAEFPSTASHRRADGYEAIDVDVSDLIDL